MPRVALIGKGYQFPSPIAYLPAAQYCAKLVVFEQAWRSLRLHVATPALKGSFTAKDAEKERKGRNENGRGKHKYSELGRLARSDW